MTRTVVLIQKYPAKGNQASGYRSIALRKHLTGIMGEIRSYTNVWRGMGC